MKINNHLFYKHSYLKHKNSAKGLHWTSKQTQEKRFEILIDFIKKDLHTVSILDAGCGFGHLLEYLKMNRLNPKNYIGVDCEKFMIDICLQNFPRYRFFEKDILKENIPINDYCICSGALNLLDKEDIFVFIENMLKSAKKGILFNHITNNFNKVSKEDVINYCEKTNCKMIIEENYLENDYTIFLKK